MGDLNKFVERMLYWCNEADLGYSQADRYNIVPHGNADCSSLVIHALKEAGFETGSASYTGNMSENLTARGWVRISPNGSPHIGDILLNDAHHVAVCTGKNQMSYASISENGTINGKPGDQTDRETLTVNGFYYSRGWNCYLRYTGARTSTVGEGLKLSVLPIIRKGSTGKAVKAMQALLEAYCYSVGSYGIDGEAGNDTINALRDFQSDNNLDPDGECGILTWTELLIG